jgi:CheY-like chemotaxis protein
MSGDYFYRMKKILIIEDNDAVRENTAELLELAGYYVLTAVNGRKGYEMAEEILPDVIICDVMMPDTDGLGFLRLAKEDCKVCKIPLIFFSAGSAPPAVKRKIETGADIYLRKPFTDNDLLGAVDACLKKTDEAR